MPFTILSLPEEEPVAPTQGKFKILALPNDAQEEQSWPAYLGEMAKGAAIPVAAGLAASRLIPGVGLVPTLAKAGIDVAAEGISQATGLSPRSNLALATAAIPGPLVEGARAVYQGGRRLLGHALPGAADILRGEAEKKALEASKVLEPPVPSKQLYQQMDKAGQGAKVAFPKTIQHAQDLEQQLQRRLYPPAEVEQFARRAEGTLSTPGTPAIPAVPGKPGISATPGTPGIPAGPRGGISFEDAQRNMSDVGDDIRKARRAGDEKLVKELAQVRSTMGEDFDQLGALSAAHKAAGHAFRQEQGAKEVESIIGNATRSEGGVNKMNVDRAINAIDKMMRDDRFFAGSFDPGKLEALTNDLRGLSKEIKKYSRRGELAFFGTAGGMTGYAVGGPLGAMTGAAASLAIPGMITEALQKPGGRAFLAYMVKEGKGTVSAPLLKAFLQTGRVAANQGIEEE